MSFLLEGVGGLPGAKLAQGWSSNVPVTFNGLVTFTGGTSGGGGGGGFPVTSTSATANAIGANGSTNPVFNVDASATSVATGINIAGAAAGSGVTVSVISSGTNETLTIAGKGTGNIALQAGAVQLLDKGGAWSSGATVRVNFGDTNTYIQNSFGGAWNFHCTTNTDLTVVAAGTSGVVVAGGISVTAGGASNALKFGNGTGAGLYWGSGLPTVSAAQGSLYIRTDGSSSSTRLYVNSSGSTTWVNVTTAS